MEATNVIVFVTEDGKEFRITEEIINMITLNENISTLLFILEKIENSIILDNINSNELNLILTYCANHQYKMPPGIKKPLRYNDLKLCLEDPSDAEFIMALNYDQITKLLLAADFLQCYSLIDLCYSRLALYFRNTPIEQLKRDFILEDTEFTEKDMKDIKEGNKWLMALSEDRMSEFDNC